MHTSRKCGASPRRSSLAILTSALASAYLLTSCASLTRPVPIEYPELPPELTRSCPPLVPMKDGRSLTILRQMLDDAEAYRVCADRHRRLVNAAELRRILRGIEHADE